MASILSKKAAAGSTHVVIDMPVGPTAKVRSPGAADALESYFHEVAKALGLAVRVLRTDGAQPVGRGVGPALEAHDVLSVLRREPAAPADLRDRALTLAAAVLELGGAAAPGNGIVRACAALESGNALRKLESICAAQGGMREPGRAPLRHHVAATRRGRICRFDNRRLARLAKLAGAPRAATAGLELHVRLDDEVSAGDRLFTIHAETPGELDYARAYLTNNPVIIDVDEPATATAGVLTAHTFPDGESLVRVDTDPRDRDVVIVATLHAPNAVVLPLLFLADALRDLGARQVGLVAPYLAYMRQDARFHPGEAITARSFADLISNAVDWVVTVDPHLHRFTSLADIYRAPAVAVHTARTIGEWVAAHVPHPLIVGPDGESRQWAESVAAAREQRTKPPVCVGVHAVFAPGAYAALQSAKTTRIATTNTIPHPSNEIDVLPEIATAVRTLLTNLKP